ncbi:MAG: TrkA family potassium uptake protein [candidate division WOR-3 bacterium]|uniref:TrkA family potassium uptake protein n=1 Tax=candidate division WOR-3 bacterium TaxID=2052148 RepID=A0A7C4W953_UNCW3
MTFCIIGLGRFGSQLAKALIDEGFDVIVIDKDDNKVNEFSDKATSALILDATDDKALKESGISEVDCAVVSVGQRIDASILITMLLKEMGVKEVVVKAVDELHAEILKRVGADKVILPEKETAIRLAKAYHSKKFFEILEVNPEYSIAEISAPKSFYNKSLQELKLREKFGVTVILIKRKSPYLNEKGIPEIKEEIIVSPKGEDVILENDILVVLGREKDLERMVKE